MKDLKIIAYKGFDEKLQGKNNFQYKVGNTYKLGNNQSLIACKQGFHFCFNLEDTFSLYSNNSKNRFCKVEIIGKYIKERWSKDKFLTDKIKILKEIKPLEINQIIHEKILEEAYKLQQKHPSLILGGSLGLLLHGIYLNRIKPNDIDFISPYYINASNKSSEFKKVNSLIQSDELLDTECEFVSGDGRDFKDHFLINGHEVEICIDPKSKWKYIEYRNKYFKVQDINTILIKKSEYAFRYGINKHLNDLTLILDQIQK